MPRPAIHPGEILADELAELGVTPTALSRLIDVPPNRVTQIIHGRRGITGDTALRLGHWFGTSAQFWLNLQSAYDIRVAMEKAGKAIAQLPMRANANADQATPVKEESQDRTRAPTALIEHEAGGAQRGKVTPKTIPATPNQTRQRSGVVSFLGAGATADAAYPVASALNERFHATLEQEKQRESKARSEMHAELQKMRSNPKILLPVGAESVDPAKDPPILGDWFVDFWDHFVEVNSRIPILAIPPPNKDGFPNLPSVVLPGPAGSAIFTPYSARVERPVQRDIRAQPAMEDFFAYYDSAMRPNIVYADERASSIRGMRHNFRQLRRHALQMAYLALSPGPEHDASYLECLFDLHGPGGGAPCIATTNFDLSIEEVLATRFPAFNDGFSPAPIVDFPAPFQSDLESLKDVAEMWNDITTSMNLFVGFNAVDKSLPKVIKLHGSLGWFALEEGSGEIGDRDELRFNSTLEFFKCDSELFFNRDSKRREPKGIVLKGERLELSRKAGAFWLQPYMIYSRNLKTHPDRLSIALIHEFISSLEASETVMVVGYSWRDPHLNDIILDEVARGIKLVNVSREPLPEQFVALVTQRFPTSFPDTAARIYTVGGGARSVLLDGQCIKPNGDIVSIDIPKLLANNNALAEFCLKDNWALRARPA
ncbi:MAG: HigA family addiction module antitoxin [Dongiaceae bacterium]